ncbi:MAG TPA: T9SS type B sorting domain-containing protein [Flavobacterium sp.]
MKKNITLLLLLIATISGYSQFSKTHYIPPLTAATYMSSTTINVDQYIYISTPSTTPVKVTITPLGGKNPVAINATVTNSTPWVYMISAPTIPDPSQQPPPKPIKPNKDAKDGQDTQLFVPTYLLGTVLKDRGYLIEANDFIYANLRVGSNVSSGSLSQAGGLVAKGLSAYGTEFRIGGMENLESGTNEAMMNFASFVATEDNTTVTITLPKAPAGTYMFPKTIDSNYPYAYPFPNKNFHYPPYPPNFPIDTRNITPTSYTSPTSKNHIYNGTITVTLNKNESYVMAMENGTSTTFESNYMLGGLIKSDRNIVVNCGSIAGTSQKKGEVIPGNITPYNSGGKDFGFDQIVGSDKTGKEFIFVGGYGVSTKKYYDLERAIIIANENGTEVFKNGSTTPVKTLNAGEYYVFNGSDYLAGNLYVTTSKNAFAYQCIAGPPKGGSDSEATGSQNMFFVPPLNCATPSAVNNIPLIDEIGLPSPPSSKGMVKFPNTIVNIVTQKFMADGVTANKVYINGTELIPGMTGLTRANVTGKTDIPFVAYSYKTTGGNMAVTASAQVYVSFYGSNDNATFGSYYSGFDTKPSITAPLGVSNSICIDGATPLKVTSAVATDEFEWIFNGVAIAGATGNTYIPKSIANGGKGPGYYTVTKKSLCIKTESLPIAVSECPANDDTDPVFNNIDMDSDNDGITNTNESYGDLPVDLSNSTGTITAGGSAYTTYDGKTTPAGAGPNIFSGLPNGSFTSDLAAGNTNTMTYDLNFVKPTSIGIKYNPAGATVASQSNATFEIKTSLNTTITISNPSNQLLIDTDNDGIYESGVTEFSSYDVKFKLNPTVLLATPAPALDFKIQTYMATSISFTHQNISNSSNSTSFSIIALSVPKDSDGDGIVDQVDTDSDNDDILDIVEAQIGNKPLANADTNKNGLDNNFDPAIAPVDTDGDLVPDYIDSDSDNDGISDKIETATNTNVSPTNTSGNYRDLDSDGDGCNDVVEAGFVDPDGDGKLGTSPTTPDSTGNGKVSGGSYAPPAGSPTPYFLVAGSAPSITSTILSAVCADRKATITVNDNGGNIYKWFVSTDNGGTWTPITIANAGNPSDLNALSYENYTTNILKINNYADKYQYRADLSKLENICSTVSSTVQTIIVADAPQASNKTYALCDKDGTGEDSMDGVTKFDLTTLTGIDTTPPTTPPATVPNTITFHSTLNGASKGIDVILDPANFINTTSPYNMDVYARVQNSAGCYTVATITLKVGVYLPSAFAIADPTAVCANPTQLGVGTFATALKDKKQEIEDKFKNAPAGAYTVTLYRTDADATANDLSKAITSLTDYKNTTANQEEIWVRVSNNNTTDFGTGTCYSKKKFTLNVEALPIPKAVGPFSECDNFNDPTDGIHSFSFGPTGLDAQILNGQNAKVTFYDETGALLPAITNSFVTKSQKIKAVVANTDPNGQKCEAAPIYIDFKVNAAPNLVTSTVNKCDGDAITTDGFTTFNLNDPAVKNLILPGYTTEQFDYYKTKNGADNAIASDLITNANSYPNPVIYTSDVWVRVTSTTCFSVAQVTLNVIVTLPSNYPAQPLAVCDSNGNGIGTFDLSTTTSNIMNNFALTPNPSDYTISYYKNNADALAKTNAITNLSTYQNIGYAYSQAIWVRVDNASYPICASVGPYVALVVEKLPVAKAIKELYRECDDNTDGQFTFTNTVDRDVKKGRTDVTVAYTDNATGVSLGNSFPTTFTTNNIKVKAVVTNNTTLACSDTTFIEFIVDVKPVTPTTPIALTECDDETDPMQQDGKTSFDASSIQSTILGAQTDATVMIIKYFAQDGTALPSPLPDTFITKTQTVTYKVENKNNLNNAGCTAQGTIQFNVSPLPLVDLNKDGKDDEVICYNLPSLTFDLTAGVPTGTDTTGYTYQWSKDGIALTGQTSNTLNGINTEGVYTVEVSKGSCPVTRTITVHASEIAQFADSNPIMVVDLAADNTITVNLKPGLKGNYGYSLDDEIGYYQDSNVFTNVSPGEHTIYVRDRNGCGTLPNAAIVIGVPKFFTPNNDGHNDYWNIAGIDPNVKYTIFIYDRYGKLLKELIPGNTKGWDGNFNLAPMPGSDYWYSLQLGNGREAKGHFSLKR